MFAKHITGKPFSMDTFSILLPELKRLIIHAGDAIMEIYCHKEQWDTQQKTNDTPVTAADLAAQEILLKGLTALTPELPVLSEEDHIPAWSTRQDWTTYWLLDPLDGTREFLQGNGEFTVNIALIHANQPIFGLVYAPASHTLYWGSESLGAWKEQSFQKATRIHVRQPDKQCLLLTSRRHSDKETQVLQTLIDQGIYTTLNTESLGSSLKFCRIAEGFADLYLRLAPTSEWDTAAAQAVLEAAGGVILRIPQGSRLQYNQQDSLTNPSFIALAKPTPEWVKTLSW